MENKPIETKTELEFFCPTETGPAVETVSPNEVESVINPISPQAEVKMVWDALMETRHIAEAVGTEINRMLYFDIEFEAYSSKHNVILVHVKDGARMRTQPDARKKHAAASKTVDNPAYISEYLQNRLANGLARDMSIKLSRPVRVQFYAGKIGPDYMHPKDRMTEECWWDSVLQQRGLADPDPLPDAVKPQVTR